GATSFNSCRSRHCPKCQTNARDKWLTERSKELLPVSYVHVVFTLPHELSWLALQNKKVVYDLLFRASAATLLKIAADPKHLGAEIGFLSVLHTWGQTLEFHPHVHCVIPSGGLSADHQEWIRPRYPFFLPVPVLGAVFRVNFADGKVTFRWKDYAHGNKKRVMTLGAEEFLRRFLLHTLPRGFVRIRSFGFLANRRRKTLLPLCRTLLNAPSPEAPEDDVKPALWRCPQCGGPMAVVERLSTQQLQWALSKSEAILDSF